MAAYSSDVTKKRARKADPWVEAIRESVQREREYMKRRAQDARVQRQIGEIKERADQEAQILLAAQAKAARAEAAATRAIDAVVGKGRDARLFRHITSFLSESVPLRVAVSDRACYRATRGGRACINQPGQSYRGSQGQRMNCASYCRRSCQDWVRALEPSSALRTPRFVAPLERLVIRWAWTHKDKARPLSESDLLGKSHSDWTLHHMPQDELLGQVESKEYLTQGEYESLHEEENQDDDEGKEETEWLNAGFDFETRPIKYWVYTPKTAAAAAGGLWSCFCSSAEGDLVLTDRFSGTFADGLNDFCELYTKMNDDAGDGGHEAGRDIIHNVTAEAHYSIRDPEEPWREALEMASTAWPEWFRDISKKPRLCTGGVGRHSQTSEQDRPEHRGRCLNNDVSNREDRPQDSRSRFDFNVSVQFPVNVAPSCDPRITYRPDLRWRWVDDLDT